MLTLRLPSDGLAHTDPGKIQIQSQPYISVSTTHVPSPKLSSPCQQSGGATHEHGGGPRRPQHSPHPRSKLRSEVFTTQKIHGRTGWGISYREVPRRLTQSRYDVGRTAVAPSGEEFRHANRPSCPNEQRISIGDPARAPGVPKYASNGHLGEDPWRRLDQAPIRRIWDDDFSISSLRSTMVAAINHLGEHARVRGHGAQAL